MTLDSICKWTHQYQRIFIWIREKSSTPMSSSPTTDITASEDFLCTKRLQRQDPLESEDKKLWGSKRLLVTILMFFSNFYLFMLRGNLSIAIVEMTSEKNITSEGRIITQKPEFAWDSRTKGWVLSLYSYGYCFATFGGYLSIRYGGVTINGLGTLITAVLTMLSPWALRTNIYLFGAGRIAEGVFESFAYASTADIWSRWVPKCELPTTLSFSFMGYMVGTAVTYPICGYIAQYWGWPMIFYISGSFAMAWCILFFKWVRNDPSQDEKISAGELKYLKEQTSAQSRNRKNITYPWKKIFMCTAIWSLCINKFAYSWAQISLILCFPLYIKDITNKSTAEVGLLSGIPNMVNLIATPLTGILIGYLQNNLGFNPSKLQKWILVVGFLMTGMLFFIVGYLNFSMSMICFVLISIIATNLNNVIQLMIVGISPNHAALVAGMTSFWFSLSSIIAPLTIGYMVVNHTRQEWGISFVFSGFVMLFTTLITALFGSSEDQKWTPVSKPQDFETVTLDKER